MNFLCTRKLREHRKHGCVILGKTLDTLFKSSEPVHNLAIIHPKLVKIIVRFVVSAMTSNTVRR